MKPSRACKNSVPHETTYKQRQEMKDGFKSFPSSTVSLPGYIIMLDLPADGSKGITGYSYSLETRELANAPLGDRTPSRSPCGGKDLIAARPPAAPLPPVHGQPPGPPSSILQTLRAAVLTPQRRCGRLSSLVGLSRTFFFGRGGRCQRATHDGPQTLL